MRKMLLTAFAGLLVFPALSSASVGGAIRGALRNPGNDLSQAYTRETQIIANVGQGQGGTSKGTGGFATRQSNKSSSGGGAIYGCRATSGTNPCIQAVNLANGTAFQFNSNPSSSSIGAFLFGSNPAQTFAQSPFTTNATGLVKNLNADAVGGLHANQLVSAGQLLFAVVDGAGKLGVNRGATSAILQSAATPATFKVGFAALDISRCAYTASPTSIVAGTVAVATGPDKRSVLVSESGASPVGFHLQLTC